MKKLAFLGASGEVTGSNFILTAQDDSQLLVDFGLFQGEKSLTDLNYRELQFDPSQLVGAVLTHAHLDHCGRLPLLVYGGFKGKIYMTEPTRELIQVILTDAAKIAQEKKEYTPLYGLEEVEKLLQMIETVKYHEPFEIGPFKINYIDAGHILGSASIEVTDKGDNRTIVFSGDIGNTPEDIINPTEYSQKADIVVMEATYGGKFHPKENPNDVLQEEINAVENNSGVLLIPAFSLERTQELLHRIYHLKKDNKVRHDTPVFMDSPMGIRATEIFKVFPEFYNKELQAHDDDPFSFEGLAITSETRDSKEIIKAMEPKVIIAGSGMMSGGRIMQHAINYLPLKTTRILFVGYQAEETLGRQITEGARNVRIKDKQITIRANVRKTDMSSHADQPKLITWLGSIKGVKKVFLVHGDPESRDAFAADAKEKLKIQDIISPQNGDIVDL